MSKSLLSFIAIILTFIAYLPYIISIYRGKTKPHVFSWIIWGITTCIIFFAQLADEGGLGAWPIGLSGLITLGVAYQAYLCKSDVTISRIDWAFFISSLATLPLWYLLSDPMWAVIILTLVDVLGFGPTIRNAYINPYHEQLTFYALFAIRNIISIGALENYSITTLCFPVVISVACIVFVMVVLVRRTMFRIIARIIPPNSIVRLQFIVTYPGKKCKRVLSTPCNSIYLFRKFFPQRR